ncbi:hypothetical protein BDK51DRAFT_33200, partial [Blyttiomyces helicus]
MSATQASSTAAPTTAVPQANPSTTTTNEPTPVHEEVVSHGEEAHTRVICIAVDESDNSTNALKFTLNHIVKKDYDQIVLLNVRAPFVPLQSFGLMAADYGDWYSHAEEEAQRQSHALLKRLGGTVVAEG